MRFQVFLKFVVILIAILSHGHGVLSACCHDEFGHCLCPVTVTQGKEITPMMPSDEMLKNTVRDTLKQIDYNTERSKAAAYCCPYDDNGGRHYGPCDPNCDRVAITKNVDNTIVEPCCLRRNGRCVDNCGANSVKLREAISAMLKHLTYNTANFTDVVTQFGKQFGTDLTPRKSSIKIMIQEELAKLAHEVDKKEYKAKSPPRKYLR